MLVNKITRKAREITGNPGWYAMRLLGRYNGIRPVAETILRRPVRERLDLSRSLFPDLNVDAAVRGLRTDGFFLGLQLPQATLDELRAFGNSATCYGNRKYDMGFTYPEKPAVDAKYPNKLALAHFYNASELCQAVRQIQEDPKLLAIAALYLRSTPVHQGSNMWWSFANNVSAEERNKAAQLYHVDLDDYRFVKFFFYLTEVNEQSGPHVIVRGTHDKKSLAHQAVIRRFTDEEIAAAYGAENVVTITGKAGSGFVEDTLCFHKGSPPEVGDRLVLQVQYALRDYNVQHDRVNPALLKRCI